MGREGSTVSRLLRSYHRKGVRCCSYAHRAGIPPPMSQRRPGLYSSPSMGITGRRPHSPKRYRGGLCGEAFEASAALTHASGLGLPKPHGGGPRSPQLGSPLGYLHPPLGSQPDGTRVARRGSPAGVPCLRTERGPLRLSLRPETLEPANAHAPHPRTYDTAERRRLKARDQNVQDCDFGA